MMCAVSFLFLTFFSLSAQLFSCRHKPLEVEHSTQTGETNSSNTPSAGSPYLVDINTAGIHELSILPGIGEITAGKIIAERNANGPFRSTEDLQRVHGIGRKKIEALEAMVAPIAVSRLAEAAPVSDTPTKPST